MESWYYIYNYYGLEPYIGTLHGTDIKILKLKRGGPYTWYCPTWSFDKYRDLLDFFVRNFRQVL